MYCGFIRRPYSAPPRPPDSISPEHDDGYQTVEEVKARHKKELKALEGSGRKLLKQANKNKAKVMEAESKIAKV